MRDKLPDLRRRLFSFFWAFSLLLFLAVCVLWVRSYWLRDELTWRHIGGIRWIRTPKGHLQVGAFVTHSWPSGPGNPFGFKYQHDQASPPMNSFRVFSRDSGDKWTTWQRGGFAWYSIRNRITGRVQVELIVPFWSIAALMAVPPLAWMIARWRSRVRERRKKSLGLCPSCGYDLRATPDRCPECGAVAAK